MSIKNNPMLQGYVTSADLVKRLLTKGQNIQQVEREVEIIEQDYAIPKDEMIPLNSAAPNWGDTDSVIQMMEKKVNYFNKATRTYSKFINDLKTTTIKVGGMAFHPELDLVFVTELIPSLSRGGISAKVTFVDRKTKKERRKRVNLKDLLPPTQTAEVLYKP